jgi:alpha-galactosidase
VLYNSWEATTFDVKEPGQQVLAEKAAKLGTELFVMDDGWFGKRNDDHAGLGDWYVNPQKFPQGLQPLISFEPEMVNPDSDLYRLHPDRAMNFPGRPRSDARNQLVLNMAREDVKEYIFGVLDKILSESNIKHIKWDMNSHFGEPGWAEAPLAAQKEIWAKYVRNVYEIIDRLRSKHPNLEMEACSGGGGRGDMGILERVNVVWTSDNTEALNRLGIQEGFTYAYAPKIMSAWVADAPNLNGRSTPLQFRFLVAMQGALGVGANLNNWTAEDFVLATRMISTYKSIREAVQDGDLCRLFPPRQGSLTANQYVSVDGKQAVLFAFLRTQQYLRSTPAIYLRGLDDNELYRVKRIDDKLFEKQEALSGAFLMRHGLNLNLSGDYDCTLVILERMQ